MQIGKTALLYPSTKSLKSNFGGFSSRIIELCPFSLGFEGVVDFTSVVVTGVVVGVSTCSVGSTSRFSCFGFEFSSIASESPTIQEKERKK